MESVGDWKGISYAQIVYFAILLAMFILITIRYFMSKKEHRATGHMKKGLTIAAIKTLIFLLCKVAGGISALVLLYAKSLSEGAFIAAYVLDSMALGVLISAVYPIAKVLVQESKEEVTYNEEPEKLEETSSRVESMSPSPGPLKGLENKLSTLCYLLILAGVITTIIGSSTIDFNKPSDGKYFKASGVLFTVAAVVLGFMLVKSLLSFRSQYKSPYYTIALIALTTIPLFLIRCVYGLLSSFTGINFDAANPNKYMLFIGKWYYYCFIGFIEECLLASIILYLIYRTSILQRMWN